MAAWFPLLPTFQDEGTNQPKKSSKEISSARYRANHSRISRSREDFMAELPAQCINRNQIQQMFNDGGYWPRAQAGEFRQALEKESHLDPLKTAEPLCTHSQFLIYYDKEDNEIARVHQYKRPDGTLGGTGRPDPKRLILEDVIYFTR